MGAQLVFLVAMGLGSAAAPVKKPAVSPTPAPPPAAPTAPAAPASGYPHVTPDPSYGKTSQPTGPKSAERQKLEAQLSDSLDALGNQIRNLRTRGSGLDGAARDRFNEALRLAAGNRVAARVKIRQLQQSPDAQWRAAGKDATSAVDDVRVAIERATAVLVKAARPASR